MQNLNKLISCMKQQQLQNKDQVYNYAIPISWNFFGYQKGRKTKHKEMIVNPYDFYMFTYEQMFLKKELKDHRSFSKTWLTENNSYYMIMKSVSAYDHDRDDTMTGINLYGFKDGGTFLKTIALLPMYERLGIKTIILQQPFSRCKTRNAHDYASPYAVYDFNELDSDLYDPMISEMSLEEQYYAFLEACHVYGIYVIFEYCPGLVGYENTYIETHPEWFYWIKKEAYPTYDAPVLRHLPLCIQPHARILKDYYNSKEIKTHIDQFVFYDEGGCIAPVFTDTINANVKIDKDLTMMRFYEDLHSNVPNKKLKEHAPYISADIIRKDLYPARNVNVDVWNLVTDTALTIQNKYLSDGIYFVKPYLIPEKLQKELVKKVKQNNKNFKMIVEENNLNEAVHWKRKGFDMISGNSGYEIIGSDMYGFQTAAYHIKDCALPVFAASETYDSIRCMYSKGIVGQSLYTVMSHFIPNASPLLYNGQEMYEVQPLYLSGFADQNALYALDRNHPNFYRQASLDAYSFDYKNPSMHIMCNMLETVQSYRDKYSKAITNKKTCIPVWFDDPRVTGLGYTYIKNNCALLVVCNTDLYTEKELYIHTENMICELPFEIENITQVYSTKYPYKTKITLDMFQNIRLNFDKGEVKLIELTGKKKESWVNVKRINITNFRDLGGYINEDGKQVKYGCFYRSGPIVFVNEESKQAFQRLQIKHIFDLRSSEEVHRMPDHEIEGVNYIHISAIKELGEQKGNFDFKSLIQNNEFYKLKDYMEEIYKQLPFSNPAYQLMFEKMLLEEVPFVFHCTAGKDRTGVAAYLILKTLGVSDEVILHDYMLSNQYREKENKEFLAKMGNFKGAEELLNVKETYLICTMNAIKEKYGDFKTYLKEEYQISEKEISLLKEKYLYK